MKINLRDIVLTVPDDPKKVGAYQYMQIRICAAKMASLTTDLQGLRQKISDVIQAVQSDAKEVALQQLELLYYSAHLATMPIDPLLECFAWITIKPERAHYYTDEDIKKTISVYNSQGLTREQAEQGVSFFLTKSELN
jgi:hypothetical protein